MVLKQPWVHLDQNQTTTWNSMVNKAIVVTYLALRVYIYIYIYLVYIKYLLKYII